MKAVALAVALGLALQAVPLSAAGGDETASTPLKASIQRAATTAAMSASPSTAPNRMPHRSGKAYYKRSGGGNTAMVLGIVGALAGVGATVYMVKEMNKDTDKIATQQPAMWR